jgi:hypothetical protein
MAATNIEIEYEQCGICGEVVVDYGNGYEFCSCSYQLMQNLIVQEKKREADERARGILDEHG